MKQKKSQISSTKLQMVRQAHHPEPSRRVNLKFQYSMTKTFPTVVSHRFANPGLPVMMPLGTTVDESFVWSAAGGLVIGICLRFGFWCLEFS
jgi:hypothetical protein